MNSPLELLWLSISQLAQQDMLVQRRTRNYEEIQHNTTPSQAIHTSVLGQTRLSLSVSSLIDGKHESQRSADEEVNKSAVRKQKQDSEPPQPTPSGIGGSRLQKRHTSIKRIIKNAKAAISHLMMTPGYLLMNKGSSRPVPSTHNASWRCIGLSVAGTSHAKKQIPCQDAHVIKELQSGELVIAVADGAGSAPLSQEGAKFAVHIAANFLCQAIPLYKPDTTTQWKTLVFQAFELARAYLIKHAVESRFPVKDYATTLQLVVIAEPWLVSAIVGDGTAVILGADNVFEMILPPQRGQYANATNFITSNSALSKITVQVRQKQVVGVAVLTDGLLNLSIEEKSNTPVPKFFQPLFNVVGAATSRQQVTTILNNFLQSDRINRRTDDDKTLVLALRQHLPNSSGVNLCDLKQTVVEELG
jgi:hypothetical protein